MSEFKIEKGIAMPLGRHNYPFPRMTVGDSFWAKAEHKNRVAAAAYSWGKENNAKFTTRKEGDGIRVWRVE